MILVLDFETTGLKHEYSDKPEDQPGITQIGAIRLTNGIECGHIDQLINPEKYFEPEAQRITGITADDVKNAPTFDEFFTTFTNLSLGSSILVGFNLPFDISILQANLCRYSLQTKFPWPPRHIDLMLISKTFMNLQGKQDTKPPSLISLHEHLFDEKFDNAHNAVHDARATARCFIEMVTREWVTI